jgi:S-formylglutathione hydrolase FrmB
VNTALIGGWLPLLIDVLAAVILVVAIGWRSTRWRQLWVPAAALTGIGLAGAAYWVVAFEALADGALPVMLWVWIALTGLAAFVAAAGWRRAQWWRRSASLAAVPLCVLCAGLALDASTGYLPTVGALWNRAADASLPSQTDEATVMDMRRHHQVPKRGVMVSVTIPDDASGFRHRGELVYLPPAWFAAEPAPESTPPLPAVLMVGGEFGHPADWATSGSAQATADDFAATHEGNAPVLVFVDTSGAFANDTECVNGIRGNAADHLTKDVVPYVVSHFGVSQEPEHWGMVGWSSGGTCALLTTVMHPDLIRSFVDIDGLLGPNAGSSEQTLARLFGGDAAAMAAFDPATVMSAHGPYDDVAGWFAVTGAGRTSYRAAGSMPAPTVGDRDDLDPADTSSIADYLCSLASSTGIECAVVPRNGGHDFGTAARVFSAALPWLAGRLGTPTAAAVTLPSAAAAP